MESIELIAQFGGYFTPELKSPDVEMPFEGDYTQEDYAQQMIDEYVVAGIPPNQVWPQSFNPDDVIYWIQNTDYGAQAVALDANEDVEFNNTAVDAWLDLLVENGVKLVAPPMFRLVEGAPDTELLMKPSYYAVAAAERGLGVITWTLERAGPGLSGWYYQTTENVVDLAEGDRFSLLHVLYQEVGILGIFSDWPATTTFYANCMGVGLRDRTGVAVSRDSFPGEVSEDEAAMVKSPDGF
jgi:glycerophosphoryl diester phosphodiesterase